MHTDKYGQIVLNQEELCDLYMRDPQRHIQFCLVDQPIHFNAELDIQNPPELIEWKELNISLEVFDAKNQSLWNMPQEYKDLDIAKWVLDKCNTDDERQRVGDELLLYLERDLFPLLQYLKYLVDIMRKYNMVWGVGRGSSVSSYVLYLIGVHKINSMYYDLPISEFLR